MISVMGLDSYSCIELEGLLHEIHSFAGELSQHVKRCASVFRDKTKISSDSFVFLYNSYSDFMGNKYLSCSSAAIFYLIGLGLRSSGHLALSLFSQIDLPLS